MVDWDVAAGRLAPYWLTVASSLFIMAYFYGTYSDEGYAAFSAGLFVPLLGGIQDAKVAGWTNVLVGIVGPIFVVSGACALLLTNHRLPSWRGSWFNKVAMAVRRHPPLADDASGTTVPRRLWAGLRFFGASLRLPFRSMAADADYGRDLASKKANQFGRGEPNFNAVALWLSMPFIIGFFIMLPNWLKYADMDEENVMRARVETVSYLFGWVSCLCLFFFLIPVTKHSVLLAAMGWSPIHALRIHIWYGYLSFVCMLIHGVMLVPVWFLYYPFPVYQQIVPNPKCWTWTWTDQTEAEIEPNCYHVFANWTGIVAAVFFIILWGSSLNWVRRTHYRLFYICHVVFGTLTILGIILHMYWFAPYFIPSLTYYLASTTPTLVQALASRFRGGVKIRQVVLVEDSGGCVEVHVEAHETANAVLNREPCQFIKLCVPKISLVWHPFDVYKSCKADGTTDDTVRFLFRPVGPFTKELAKRLTSNVERPVTLVDGFYLGADKSELAMQHDCVTMVAGGVALSPYLTLIPALLNRISKEGAVGGVKTKSIVLHWVCREPGLCTYYVDNYLKAILQRATFLNVDATLTLNVYLTGGKLSNGKFAIDGSELDTLEGSSRFIEPHPVDNGGSDRSPDETEAGDVSDQEKRSDQDKRSDDARGGGNIAIIDPDSTGHPLELARMLPRRHSSAAWNLPFFTYFTGVSAFGIWYLLAKVPDPYANYPEYTGSYYIFSMMTWFTMYAILMYFSFGILSEACVLGLRKFWPKPSPDQFAVVVAGPAKWEEASDESSDDVKKVEEARPPSDKVTLLFHEGRPAANQIFKDARSAVEPGIFMCGPTALTRMVKDEASKENSYLGLTRFCLYDEPYEM